MILVFFETGCKTLVHPPKNNNDEEDKNEDSDAETNEDEVDNEIVEHETVEMDERTIKFLASFFTIILELNFKRLPIVAQRFEIP
jgi:hypothetical protein